MSDGWYTGNFQNSPKNDFVEKTEKFENSENSEILKKNRGGRKSRDKGQRGEREVAKIFIAAMEEVEGTIDINHWNNPDIRARCKSQEVKRNTTQSDRGGYDLSGVPLLAIEVKFCETFSLDAWWQQTLKQSHRGEFPVLIYRCSRQPWRVRSYVSLQFPIMSDHMQWIVADYSLEEFLAWYRVLYRAQIFS